MPKLTLIIPCYNEGKRLNPQAFSEALHQWPGLLLFFVNDASLDETGLVLDKIQREHPREISIINHSVNQGKAASVRTGMLEALAREPGDYIGYLDADLSTSFEEFFRISALGIRENADYFFASRVKMLNHRIERTFFRHVAGRVVASLTDIFCKLRIYDTQCGAKLFRTSLVKPLLQAPFHTKWLFDIEIFMRIRRVYPQARGLEIPLISWKEYGKSKITPAVIPQVCLDLFHLYRNYP